MKKCPLPREINVIYHIWFKTATEKDLPFDCPIKETSSGLTIRKVSQSVSDFWGLEKKGRYNPDLQFQTKKVECNYSGKWHRGGEGLLRGHVAKIERGSPTSLCPNVCTRFVRSVMVFANTTSVQLLETLIRPRLGHIAFLGKVPVDYFSNFSSTSFGQSFSVRSKYFEPF